MPIKKVEQEFSIEVHIKPILKRAGYKISWVHGYRRGNWQVNKHTALWNEPSRPGRSGLKLIGPDALEIAKVIEKAFPSLDIQVTETERPRPGLIARFFQSLTKAEGFI